MKENGLTVLLSTHTLDVADEVCDQVAVNRGCLIAQGTTSELRSQTGTEGQRLERSFYSSSEAEQLRRVDIRPPRHETVNPDVPPITLAFPLISLCLFRNGVKFIVHIIDE